MLARDCCGGSCWAVGRGKCRGMQTELAGGPVLRVQPARPARQLAPAEAVRRGRSSAVRASELGDGTLEVREVQEALEWVQLLRRNPDLLATMNDRIMANAKQGVSARSL